VGRTSVPAYYEDGVDCTSQLVQMKLDRGRRLIDQTTYDQIALWWFVDLNFVDFLGAMVKAGETTQLRAPRYRFLRSYKRFEVVFTLLQLVILRIVVRVFGRNRGKQSRFPKILFTAQDVEWRVIHDYESGITRKSDAFFDSILKHLAKECNSIGVFPTSTGVRIIPSSFVHSVQTLIDKLKHWYVPQVPFEFYWTLNSWNSERKASRLLANTWTSLRNYARMRQEHICNGVSWSDVEARLEYCFRFTFPFAVRFISIAKRMIEIEKPDLILIVNEYGFFEKALVIAGKLSGVPTLAIQHGTIHSSHKGYMYRKGEILPDGRPISPYTVIPDRTAVYSSYYRDLLTQISAYPENSVVVTGQPRYDKLSQLSRIYSRDTFNRKYHINPGNKIVLWTTECDGLTFEENMLNFKVVFNVARVLKRVTLVVRQHPGETEMYTRIMQQHLQNSGTNAILLSGDTDFYEQLYACDLLIAKYSTSAVEAAAIDKPVVVLNLTRDSCPEGCDYVKQGIALGVNEEDELQPSIEELLRNDSALAKNRKQFAEKYLYKTDGKSTERVVELIRQMLKPTKQ
jgi:hypothetical protein